MHWDRMLRTTASTFVFGLLGIVALALVIWLTMNSLPFSLRKEIEDDQNISLGVIVAGVIVGVAWILSAAIEG